MLMMCTSIMILLFLLSSAPTTLPLVQEIFVEFSTCKKGIETLRNDLIILENSISTIADCSEKDYKPCNKTKMYADRFEQSEVKSNNRSVDISTNGAGPDVSENEDESTSDHTLLYSAHQNISNIQYLFQVCFENARRLHSL
jgi:hypothetical protein